MARQRKGCTGIIQAVLPPDPKTTLHTDRHTSFTRVRRSPLRVPEAAEYLGVNERYVRRLRAEHKIAFHKIGKILLFDPDDLDEYLATTKIPAVVSRSNRGT